MHTQTQLKMNKDKILTLKNVTKSSIWELQENDVFRLWEAAEKDADLKDYQKSRITTTIQMRMTMHSMTTSLLRKATVLPSKTRRTSVLMMQKT